MPTNNAWNSSIPVEISKGGTNASSMANTNGTVIFDGTSLVTVDPSTSGFVLTSNGASAPTFQAGGGGGTKASFYAYIPDQFNATGDGTFYNFGFSGESLTLSNIGSAYDTATGFFTAPATGNYCFQFGIYLNNCTIAGEIQTNIGNAISGAALFFSATRAPSNVDFTSYGSGVLNATAGDIIYFSFGATGEIAATDTIVGSFNTFFCGFQL